MKNLKKIFFISLFFPLILNANSIFDFKPKENLENKDIHVESNFMVPEYDTTNLSEEQIVLVRKIIKETFIELFFNGVDPNLSKNESMKTSLLDLSTVTLIGESGDYFLVQDNLGATHLVNKQVYMNQKSPTNNVIKELFNEEMPNIDNFIESQRPKIDDDLLNQRRERVDLRKNRQEQQPKDNKTITKIK